MLFRSDVRLFDVYRGNPLAADEKSLAYRLTFRAPDRTLAALRAHIRGRIGKFLDALEALMARVALVFV